MKRLTTAAKLATPAETEELALKIIRNLRTRANSTRAQGVQQYFKNEIVALGIDAPTLRQFAKEHAKEIRSRWALADGVALCDRLLREQEFEIRGAGILMLTAFRKQYAPDLLATGERWLRTQLDNWALVDSFCSLVLSPLIESYPAAVSTLQRWAGAKSIWVRRASLVTLVPFARRGKMLDLAYQMAREHFGASEDLLHKATGWLLREAGKTDMPRLKRFLLLHGPSIPRTSVRYAIERLPEDERRELLEGTRQSTAGARAPEKGEGT